MYFNYIFICPVAIAYSMGHIIKSVCVCQSVSVSVRLRALSRSHFLIDFYRNWHRRKNPKRKNEFVRGIYRTTPSYFALPNTHFRPAGPENPCKYQVIILNVCESPKFRRHIGNRGLGTR